MALGDPPVKPAEKLYFILMFASDPDARWNVNSLVTPSLDGIRTRNQARLFAYPPAPEDPEVIWSPDELYVVPSLELGTVHPAVFRSSLNVYLVTLPVAGVLFVL